MANQVVKHEADSVKALLERMKPEFASALPAHLTPDRLLRVAMTTIRNTPKLLDCDRTSLFSSIMTCAQLGLEPDGTMGQAYLVPFRGKVQLIVGYKGYLTLARNSGEVSSIQAHEVRQHDLFEYSYGLEEKLNHTPAEGERGEITHFYAYAKFKDGGHVFEVMTAAEVNKVRDNSDGYKAFKANKIKSTPWADHYEQMGRKTAIRRLANYLPMSVQRAAALDAAYDSGQHASTDKFGDLVIEGESEPVNDDAPAGDAVTSKLDDLANSRATSSPAEAETIENRKPSSQRFFVNEDADIVDRSTGEVVPENLVLRHDDGTFTIKAAYLAEEKAQQPDNNEGLFGANS